MKRTLFVFAALIILCFVFVQCSDKSTDTDVPDGPQHPSASDITASDKSLAQADNVFGMKLFHELLGHAGDENIFISPLSVSLALTMAYNGADGITKDAMHTALELNDMTPDEVNQSSRNLIDVLTAIDPSVTFNIANSIWYRQGLPVEQEFIDVNSEYLYADVNEADFSDGNTADVINGWVSENTRGKITQIIDADALPDLIMLLLNAIYFKGSWSDKFDADLTETADFTLADNNQVSCNMMIKDGTFDHYYSPEFQAVRLPYGADSMFNMVAVLPGDAADIATFGAQFDFDDWKTVLSNLHPYDCVLGLPRFKIEYEKSLVGPLVALGMGSAFDAAADFGNMVPGMSLALSEVRHKTYVEVNEEGTEAAAVTGVIVSTSLPPMIYFDRPFLVFIYEKTSGAIIFAGRVMNPTSGS